MSDRTTLHFFDIVGGIQDVDVEYLLRNYSKNFGFETAPAKCLEEAVEDSALFAFLGRGLAVEHVIRFCKQNGWPVPQCMYLDRIRSQWPTYFGIASALQKLVEENVVPEDVAFDCAVAVTGICRYSNYNWKEKEFNRHLVSDPENRKVLACALELLTINPEPPRMTLEMFSEIFKTDDKKQTNIPARKDLMSMKIARNMSQAESAADRIVLLQSGMKEKIPLQVRSVRLGIEAYCELHQIRTAESLVRFYQRESKQKLSAEDCQPLLCSLAEMGESERFNRLIEECPRSSIGQLGGIVGAKLLLLALERDNLQEAVLCFSEIVGEVDHTRSLTTEHNRALVLEAIKQLTFAFVDHNKPALVNDMLGRLWDVRATFGNEFEVEVDLLKLVVVTWVGDTEESRSLRSKLDESGIVKTRAVRTILTEVMVREDPKVAMEKVLEELGDDGLAHDDGRRIVIALTDLGRVGDALSLASKMGEHVGVKAFHRMLVKGSAYDQFTRTAFRTMLESGLKPTKEIFTLVLGSLLRSSDIKSTLITLEYMVEDDRCPLDPEGTTLLPLVEHLGVSLRFQQQVSQLATKNAREMGVATALTDALIATFDMESARRFVRATGDQNARQRLLQADPQHEDEEDMAEDEKPDNQPPTNPTPADNQPTPFQQSATM